VAWTVISGDPGRSLVLLVAADHLEPLAQRVAATRCYVFCATPDAVPHVLATAIVDLVVVLPDLTTAQRLAVSTLYAVHSRQAGRFVVARSTDPDDIAELVEQTLRSDGAPC
jgi:hypothetical protein